jgi:hypothetical protein
MPCPCMCILTNGQRSSSSEYIWFLVVVFDHDRLNWTHSNLRTALKKIHNGTAVNESYIVTTSYDVTLLHAWLVSAVSIVSLSPFCRVIVHSFSCWIVLVQYIDQTVCSLVFHYQASTHRRLLQADAELEV